MIATLKRHKWLAVLAMLLLFAMAFVVMAFLYSLGSASGTGSISWKGLGLLVAFFASLGALYGSVAALDSTSGMSVGSHPILRTLMCAVFGATTVLAVGSGNPADFSNMWWLAGAFVGGVLGWLGWRWAKYVDF
jgi:hypothetical protein